MRALKSRGCRACNSTSPTYTIPTVRRCRNLRATSVSAYLKIRGTQAQPHHIASRAGCSTQPHTPESALLGLFSHTGLQPRFQLRNPVVSAACALLRPARHDAIGQPPESTREHSETNVHGTNLSKHQGCACKGLVRDDAEKQQRDKGGWLDDWLVGWYYYSGVAAWP